MSDKNSSAICSHITPSPQGPGTIAEERKERLKRQKPERTRTVSSGHARAAALMASAAVVSCTRSSQSMF